jgi:hypothetical protein
MSGRPTCFTDRSAPLAFADPARQVLLVVILLSGYPRSYLLSMVDVGTKMASFNAAELSQRLDEADQDMWVHIEATAAFEKYPGT